MSERALGTEFGGYQLEDRIGSGGMGVVYHAIDADGRDVAMKVIHPHIATDPEARKRLRREVEVLQRVRHPAVARVLDAEADSNDVFIVTELVDGCTLDASVKKDGVFIGMELADFAEDLRGALAAIHSAGVVHRDLKPSNVMVTESGPVLIDFGIAQMRDDAKLTETGLIVGTPGYLAPELLQGGVASYSSDWWAWAALLLYAATGRPAFGRGPVPAILSRVFAGSIDVDGLAPTVAGVFARALDQDPARRPAPEETVAELLRCAEEGAYDAAATSVLLGSTIADPVAPQTVRTSIGNRADEETWGRPAGTEAVAADDLDGYDLDPTEHGVLMADDPVADDDGFVEDQPLAATRIDAYRGHLPAAEIPPSYPPGGRPVEEPVPGEYESPYAPAEAPPASRGGTMTACAVAIGATALWVPGVAVFLLLVVVFLSWVWYLGVQARARRRMVRGKSRFDTLTTTLSAPWWAAQAFFPTVLVGAISIGAGGAVCAGALWLAQNVGSGVTHSVVMGTLIVSVAIALLLAFAGPLSSRTRRGFGALLRLAAPTRLRTAAIVIAALVWTIVVFTVQVLQGGWPEWWPLPVTL